MSNAPGYYGKLGGAGDFVHRRLPPAFLDPWDRAFSHALVESRDRLGDGWTQAFHASPRWCFLLAPGACGDAAWAGVMGPSADRVGRCFPMAVVARLPGGAAQPGVLHDGARWFGAAAELVRRAQQERRTDAEAFDTQVAALGLPRDPDDPTAPVLPAALAQATRDHWTTLPERPPVLLNALWSRLGRGGSLWWHESGRSGAPLLIHDGLPGREQFLAFLGAATRPGVAEGVPA